MGSVLNIDFGENWLNIYYGIALSLRDIRVQVRHCNHLDDQIRLWFTNTEEKFQQNAVFRNQVSRHSIDIS